MPKMPEAPTPNRLHQSEIIPLSRKPRIGILALDTDNGIIELAINTATAETLLAELQDFLNPK